jgi:hypothetical protein
MTAFNRIQLQLKPFNLGVDLTPSELASGNVRVMIMLLSALIILLWGGSDALPPRNTVQPSSSTGKSVPC